VIVSQIKKIFHQNFQKFENFLHMFGFFVVLFSLMFLFFFVLARVLRKMALLFICSENSKAVQAKSVTFCTFVHLYIYIL